MVLACTSSPNVYGQRRDQPNRNPTLRLSTQGEVPLSDFIDYVAQRLNLRFLYDDSLRKKNVNLVAPDPIPVDSLGDILQSVLLNEGLIITDTDELGFKRITTNDEIPRVARPSRDDEKLSDVGAAVPITRLFVLGEARPSEIATQLKPFLSQVGSSTIPLDRSKILIITDVARNIRRAEQLMKILDGEQAQVDIQFVPAKNVAVDELAKQLVDLQAAKRRAAGIEDESASGLEVSVDDRTNSLILVGRKPEIAQALQLLKQLDMGLETEQQTYSLRFVSPEGFDDTIREILSGRAIKPPYRSRVEGNSLIVDSTPEILSLIDRTQRQVDTREAPDAQSPVRFYRIKNVPAQELIETIRGIGANVTNTQQQRPSVPTRRQTTNDLAVPGPNQSPLGFPGAAQPVRNPLTPPAFQENRLPGTANDFALPATPGINNEAIAGTGFNPGFPLDLVDGNPEDQPMPGLIGEAQVTVDVHTNTIIVVAKPEVQRIYAKLIETLDERRPQVLIEAQIVIIDTSDDYTLGVEVSGGDRDGLRRLFSFSSFGLSTVDPTSGALSIIPGVGFNGTLVDPSTADVVVRAIAQHRRARVLSTPRVLVNDNAEGQLVSVLEVPFTSVNASQTVATTSFAGFAEAGTTITATPTISDDNYLQLEYTVTLNSFTGTGSDGVPPPRQTNEISSRVTVPDGYTVIVGGLTSKNQAYEIDSIPWLERIPVVRDLASLQTDSFNQTSLFVFLKPVILREDKFKDLKFLSDTGLRDAGEKTNFPTSAPLTIE